MKRTLAGAATLVALMPIVFLACGSETGTVNPEERLCGGESGFGARLTGRASDVDVCVSDGDARVILNSESYYSIIARMTSGGTTFEFQLLFPHNPNFPVEYNLTGNLAAALGDPFGAWMYYQEIPDNGATLESYEITGGSFTLSFSDTNVLAATFTNVTMKVRNQETEADAGTRGVERGFMSLSADA